MTGPLAILPDIPWGYLISLVGLFIIALCVFAYAVGKGPGSTRDDLITVSRFALIAIGALGWVAVWPLAMIALGWAVGWPLAMMQQL